MLSNGIGTEDDPYLTLQRSGSYDYDDDNNDDDDGDGDYTGAYGAPRPWTASSNGSSSSLNGPDRVAALVGSSTSSTTSDVPGGDGVTIESNADDAEVSRTLARPLRTQSKKNAATGLVEDVTAALALPLDQLGEQDYSGTTAASKALALYVKHQKAIHGVVSAYLAHSSPKYATKPATFLYRTLLALCWTTQIPTSQLIPELASVSGAHSRAVRILHFFQFLKVHHQIVGTALCEVYDDRTHVQTVLLPTLAARIASLAGFVQKLNTYVANGKQTRASTKPATVPNPPVLTRVRTPQVPVNVAIPVVAPARDVPASHYEKPKEQLELEAQRRMRRRELQVTAKRLKAEKLAAAAAAAAAMAEENVFVVKLASDSALVPHLPPLPHAPGHIPAINNNNTTNMAALGSTRTTAATILRESAMHAQREKAERRALEAAMCGLVDPGAVDEMEQRAREARRAQEEADRRKKRLLVHLGREEAGIQREVSVKEKQSTALKVKAEIQARMAELEVAQRESDADNRARVIAVQECADRAAEAKVRVAEENARIAREAAAAAEAAKEAAAEQARADLEAKRELIRQIRALEAAALALVGVSSGAGAVLDRTQTCGTGLLTEMSVAELKERLSAAKTMAAESEEARRKEINTGRDERVRKVAQAAEYVAQARLVASTATSSQRSTGFSTRSKYGTASRGGGATPTLDRSGLGGISSILDEAAARLQAHSQVDDMEKQLALKRLERLKLVKENPASPHRYRVRIKHIPKPIEKPPPAPISASVPNLALQGGYHRSTWKRMDPKDIGLKQRTPTTTAPATSGQQQQPMVHADSAPLLTALPQDNDATTMTRSGKKLEGPMLMDAIRTVLGLDQVI